MMKNWNLLTCLVVTLGSLCVVFFVASGPLNRFSITNFRTSLGIFSFAVKTAFPIAAIAFIATIVSFMKQMDQKMIGSNLVVFILCALIVTAGMMFKAQAQSLPVIHDISTDTANPPVFKAVLPLRADAVNPVEYEGAEIAKQQATAYPDIKPLELGENKQKSFDEALDAAKKMKWDIVDQSLTDGRIEAVATTAFFGFKDDVVIRLTEISPETTRLDIRSLSRVGKSDVGANAARIRKYFAMLKKNQP
jgi:uncharacterized protein (DUF1499 family)